MKSRKRIGLLKYAENAWRDSITSGKADKGTPIKDTREIAAGRALVKLGLVTRTIDGDGWHWLAITPEGICALGDTFVFDVEVLSCKDWQGEVWTYAHAGDCPAIGLDFGEACKLRDRIQTTGKTARILPREQEL